MKLLLTAAFALIASSYAHAGSFQISPERADRLVNAFVAMGSEPLYTHEYFKAGVSACQRLIDKEGTYFQDGKIGDTIGESCLLYGSSAETSDTDGTLRVTVMIPRDDRSLARHPEVAAEIKLLIDLRKELTAIVVPVIEMTDGVVTKEMVGVRGVACDGRDSHGARVCFVLPSSLCAPRN